MKLLCLFGLHDWQEVTKEMPHYATTFKPSRPGPMPTWKEHEVFQCKRCGKLLRTDHSLYARDYHLPLMQELCTDPADGLPYWQSAPYNGGRVFRAFYRKRQEKASLAAAKRACRQEQEPQ